MSFDEAVLMSALSTHLDKIQSNKKSIEFSWIFVFFSYKKNFQGTQKRVRISHGKRAICARIIEVLLYCENRG